MSPSGMTDRRRHHDRLTDSLEVDSHVDRVGITHSAIQTERAGRREPMKLVDRTTTANESHQRYGGQKSSVGPVTADEETDRQHFQNRLAFANRTASTPPFFRPTSSDRFGILGSPTSGDFDAHRRCSFDRRIMSGRRVGDRRGDVNRLRNRRSRLGARRFSRPHLLTRHLRNATRGPIWHQLNGSGSSSAGKPHLLGLRPRPDLLAVTRFRNGSVREFEYYRA
ncbi:hypothetical protein NE237_016359 [Protea cynaroides]|uniref:Uncharacterized protein n=1 Tax=Protea cynaroides TaxID=273540 RepID=A0A9Q0GKE5_9MAGN|nr:hypothetical protein NE237_016359 [Protea cynaroides]